MYIKRNYKNYYTVVLKTTKIFLPKEKSATTSWKRQDTFQIEFKCDLRI